MIGNTTYSYSIQRTYDYIHSISGLPPSNNKDFNVECALVFNDLMIPIESDANGIYKFIEPLPISLLPYSDTTIQIKTTTINPDLRNKLITYPYTNVTGQFNKSIVPLDKNSIIKIKIRSIEKLQNDKNYKTVDLNATIRDGTINFN